MSTIPQHPQQGKGGEVAWSPDYRSKHPEMFAGSRPIVVDDAPPPTPKTPPIGVPFPTKRKGTRYQIQRRHDPVIGETQLWADVTVVVAHGAKQAIKIWAEAQDPKTMATDALKVYVRAVPVSRITQQFIAVEQRSTLTFS